VLHRDAGQGRHEAIRSAIREITVPLIGSTITPVVVFIPLIVITGVTGVFFRALAVTMSVSLLTSLVLALTWTPTLSLYFIRGKHEKNRGSSTTADPHLDNPGLTNRGHGNPAVDVPPAEEKTEIADARQLLAAEDAHLSGFFLRIVNFHQRWLRRALERPWLLVIFSGLLIVLAYV